MEHIIVFYNYTDIKINIFIYQRDIVVENVHIFTRQFIICPGS